MVFFYTAHACWKTDHWKPELSWLLNGYCIVVVFQNNKSSYEKNYSGISVHLFRIMLADNNNSLFTKNLAVVAEWSSAVRGLCPGWWKEGEGQWRGFGQTADVANTNECNWARPNNTNSEHLCQVSANNPHVYYCTCGLKMIEKSFGFGKKFFFINVVPSIG